MARKDLKERLRQKAVDLKSKSSSGSILYLKDGDKIRVRILNMGADEEFVKEVTQFYLGGDIKGVISPSTFDEPCALFDKYQELLKSEDENDRKLAKKFNIRKRYMAYCLVYKDLKGSEIDDRSPRFVLFTGGIYQKLIESYLDEDDWGDMSDPTNNGYDIKLGRTGAGKTDTEYTYATCPKTACPKPFGDKVYNLDEAVRSIMPSFEETQEILHKFLGNDVEDDSSMEASPRASRRRRRGSEDI